MPTFTPPTPEQRIRALLPAAEEIADCATIRERADDGHECDAEGLTLSETVALLLTADGLGVTDLLGLRIAASRPGYPEPYPDELEEEIAKVLTSWFGEDHDAERSALWDAACRGVLG